jgi:hypothetical protein
MQAHLVQGHYKLSNRVLQAVPQVGIHHRPRALASSSAWVFLYVLPVGQCDWVVELTFCQQAWERQHHYTSLGRWWQGGGNPAKL